MNPEHDIDDPELDPTEVEDDADQDADDDAAMAAAYDTAMAEDGDEPPAEAAAETPAPADDEPPAADDAPITAKTPEHWSDADKAFMKSLPNDAARIKVQEWRRSIEGGATKKFQEAGEIRRTYEEVDQALSPIDQQLAQHGITRGDAVSRLVQAHLDLGRDLGGTLAKIAGQYGGRLAGTDQALNAVRQIAQTLGVDIGGGGQPGPHQAANGRDPAALAEEAAQRVYHQHHMNDLRTSAQGKLKTFVEAKDESGQARHPHYEAVKPVMQGLLLAAAQSGQNLSLEEAYAQAVWSKPDLREGLTKAQQAEAAKEAEARRRSKLAKVQGAGTPRTKSSAAKESDFEEDADKLLGDIFDNRMAAV